MKRTRIIYGTAAAVVVAVIGLAVYDQQDDGNGATTQAVFDPTPAEEYIAQDRYGRLGDMYREIVPNATDDQIEAWEADREAYEAQQAEAEQCELDAQADMDQAAGGYDMDPDGLQAEADAAMDRWLNPDHPLTDDEYDQLMAEADEARARADEAQDQRDGDYNAAVDRANACDNQVDRSLIEDHPLYEVDGDTVTYLGP